MGSMEFCLQDIIDKKLKQMKSLSNGIISEVKKQSKLKSWTSELKRLLEWRNEELKLNETAKKETKRREIDDKEEDFMDETPPKKFKLFPSKKAAKKRVPKDTSKASTVGSYQTGRS